MTDAPDNPAAYPSSSSGFGAAAQPGMTLRDWFAGQALVEVASLITVKQPDTLNTVARLAYDLADAMLAARKAKP